MPARELVCRDWAPVLGASACNASLAVATTQSINRHNTTHQVQQQAKDAREPALALWYALVCAAHCRMLRVGNDGSGLLGVW